MDITYFRRRRSGDLLGYRNIDAGRLDVDTSLVDLDIHARRRDVDPGRRLGCFPATTHEGEAHQRDCQRDETCHGSFLQVESINGYFCAWRFRAASTMVSISLV